MTAGWPGNAVQKAARADGAGGFESAIEAAAGNPPSAPPVFTTVAGSNSISAVVSNPNGATRYNVRVDSGTAQDGSVATGLTPEQTYSFQIQGENDDGVSAWSTATNETTTAVGAYTALTDPARQFAISIDAVGGTVGVNVEDDTGILSGKEVFTGEAGGTTYSDEIQIDGANVLRLSIPQGFTGYGTLGGGVTLANHQTSGTNLFKGDEFWIRTKVRFPSASWQWNSGMNKFFRARVSGVGYIDLYIDPTENRNTGRQLWWIFEGENAFVTADATPIIPYDSTHTIEMHIVLDDVPGDQGGKALQRVWVDGQLYIDTTKRTLNLPDQNVFLAAIFLYYGNEGAPFDMHGYAKNFDVQSSVPAQRDANGNPFIGV